MQSQRSPEGMAGGAIGLGLARLFGKPSSEMQAAEQMQQAIAGVDPNDPKALRELAQTVSQFAPERALQIAAYAGELEKSKQGAVVNVPTKVGQKPIYKQNAKTLDFEIVGYEDQFENIPHERTAEGLVPLVDISQYQTQPTADTTTPDAPVPDYITNEQGVVVPNPAKTATATTQAQASTQSVTSSVSPEAAERMSMQSGESRGARTGETGVGVRMPPAIQGEITFANPVVLQEEIDAKTEQLKTLPRTSKNRRRLQQEIAELRKEKRKFSSKTSSISRTVKSLSYALL